MNSTPWKAIKEMALWAMERYNCPLYVCDENNNNDNVHV